MWALVETALWFPSSGGRCSSVHGCGSIHAVVELREDARDLHHLTGHYLFLLVLLGLAYAALLCIVWVTARGRSPSVEHNQLVLRSSEGRAMTAISLAQPFDAKCIHYNGDWALYRVKQGRTVLRVCVARSDNARSFSTF